MEIGKIKKKEKIENWYQEVKKEFQLSANLNEFLSIYDEEFDKVYYYKEVVDLITTLENKCKLGILSNLGYFDKKRLDKQVNLKRFDYVWLSFELGCKKPEPMIYQIVEQESKLDTKQILFIDDDKDNVLMAKKRGWNTCRAFGYELDKIKNEILRFLENS